MSQTYFLTNDLNKQEKHDWVTTIKEKHQNNLTFDFRAIYTNLYVYKI